MSSTLSSVRPEQEIVLLMPDSGGQGAYDKMKDVHADIIVFRSSGYGNSELQVRSNTKTKYPEKINSNARSKNELEHRHGDRN